MKVGRVVVWAGPEGKPLIGSVSTVNSNSLMAVTEKNGAEVELARGTAHKINDRAVEELVSAFTGVALPVPAFAGVEYEDEEDEEGEEEEDEEGEEEEGGEDEEDDNG